MTAHRTHALVAALSFTAAATLSACGGSSGDDPTTQSVDEYAKTQAAKRKSTTKTSEPSGTPTSTESDSSTTGASGSKPTSQAPSSSREPLPNEPTDQAQVSAATKFVKSYLDAFNRAARKPSTRDSLDKFTVSRCKSCASLKGVVDQLAANKQRFKGDGLVWRSSVAETTGAPDTLELFVKMSQQPTQVLDRKNKVVNHVKKRDKMEKAFSVRSAGGALKITAIKESV